MTGYKEHVRKLAELDKDWNKEFRSILEESETENPQKWKKLSRLAKDFAYSSKLFAKVWRVSIGG